MTDHIGDINKMVFTDDDLKRLKDPDDIDLRGFTLDEFKALLARLEASERCIESLCVDEADMEAWRKAAGK